MVNVQVGTAFELGVLDLVVLGRSVGCAEPVDVPYDVIGQSSQDAFVVARPGSVDARLDHCFPD
jgi:hypothetical protein